MRLAFLVRLNDRLRQLDAPEEIAFEAARLLGEFTGADRVGYAEDGGDGKTVTVTRNYTAGVPGIEGRYRYVDYDPTLLRNLRAGRTVVRPDIAHDPSLSGAAKAAHEALQVGALVNVPLLKGGQLHAILLVHARAARHWTPGEVALFEDVAERLRADLARARAEAELRATRTWLATALGSMNEAVFAVDASGRFLHANQAFLAFYRFDEASPGPRNMRELRHKLQVFLPDGTPAAPRQRPVQRALRGESCRDVEYVLRRSDTGELRHGVYSFAPMRDAGGRIVGAVVTARDVTEHKRLHAELEAAQAELRRLLAALEQAREQERLRIARELHDDLQQTLAAVLVEAGVARGGAGVAGGAVQAALSHIEALARQALTSTRRIIRDLRPQALEELGLVAALQGLAAQVASAGGPACTVDASALEPAGEPRLVPLATTLYRVTQEALNNVVKHASARTVRIVLGGGLHGALRLSITDDGVGLPQGRALRPDAFGLAGMRERVRAVGGTLRLRSRPGWGTTVEVRIPGPSPGGFSTRPEPASRPPP